MIWGWVSGRNLPGEAKLHRLFSSTLKHWLCECSQIVLWRRTESFLRKIICNILKTHPGMSLTKDEEDPYNKEFETLKGELRKVVKTRCPCIRRVSVL